MSDASWQRLPLPPWRRVRARRSSRYLPMRIRPFDVAVPPRFDHDAELLGFFEDHSFLRADASTLPASTIGELTFALLPISWRFARGHRVRLVLAGGDGDPFARPRATTLRVHRTAAHPSRLELPVVAGPSA